MLFESRIHKVTIKPPDIIEHLSGVQFLVLTVSTSNLSGTVNITLASTLATCDNTMMRFFFQFLSLHSYNYKASALH